ncbi:MAG: FtsL-like putative cell division protein [Chloroherpetonaceae bacterium]|nr:FtsL-like putative cell division protein [Chloroherpetonaceae bacterium]MCS7211384.1 FtsL-like putative cell division protein [Chloroherpetonaceae bacterium]MDW8020210.1 FtsL-like putative cell division protein [Chloroherpetonaceae bacterium]
MKQASLPDTVFSTLNARTEYADVPVFDTPNPEPLPGPFGCTTQVGEHSAFVGSTAQTESAPVAPTEAPKKKLREKAQEKVESILNLRTFLFIAGITLVLALYIYNVISINRLSGETEALKKEIEAARSLNVELESQLKALQRVEHISAEAYKRLGLRYKTEPPVELKSDK